MRLRLAVFCALFLLLVTVPALADGTKPTDLDSYTEALTIDYSQAAQLPLTGWFTKNVSEGRTMKIYIAPEASIRTYFTVIAVPNDVDTYEFLDSNGWFDLMDEKGEGLVVLEPGQEGWGSAQDELNYVNAAMGVVRSGMNGNGIPVLSSFGEFYIVGCGDGAAPIELWAASNPILVISQVYADGSSNQEDLTEAGAPLYDGTNTFTNDEDFFAALERTSMKQIAKKDVPIPTWLINYEADSVSANYWKYANDCSETSDDGIYWQEKNSKRAQTLYANSQLSDHGISQVKISSGDIPGADELYEWLSVYTRYDVTFAYSNALAYRLDYTAARVGAQKQAKDGVVLRTYEGTDWKGNAQNVEILAQSDTEIPGHGTVQAGVFAFSDNNDDGKNDPREYIVYVPDGFNGAKLPVLFVYPGNTQTDGIFFDCTQWYQVADKEGIVLVVVCETYGSPISVTHVDSYLYQTAMMTVLRNDIDGSLANLDFTRVYATGQSLGSMTTQDMARVNPGFFAAVASTSGNTYAVGDLSFGSDPSSDMPIPTMMMIGQSDLPGLMPDLSSEALTTWANYFMQVNGLDKTVGAKQDDFGADNHEFIDNRHEVYTWNKNGIIPVFSWGLTLLRPHNCYPSEMPILWNFLKHFSLNENGTRYYSSSAFVEDDGINLSLSGGNPGSSSSGCNSFGINTLSVVMLSIVAYMKKR